MLETHAKMTARLEFLFPSCVIFQFLLPFISHSVMVNEISFNILKTEFEKKKLYSFSYPFLN